MNPDTNKFEVLKDIVEDLVPAQRLAFVEAVAKTATARLLRPDGSEAPKHWAVFKVGELVVIKDYTFKVAYIGETSILFEPVGPQIISESDESDCAPCVECALNGHCAWHG
jgi:hypothetical protein